MDGAEDTANIGGIPDLLRPGLSLVFCGYNPSLMSGRTGHNYAHPGNRFWRVLHAAGITERLYAPEEGALLLEQGIGFTNIVPRPTRRADELSRAEIRAGADALRAKLESLRPRAVAYTGIGVYQWLRGTSKVTWGVQTESAVPGVTDIVIPSPSGLNRMSFDELVEHYRAVLPFVERG
jgi:double-stranded uracil-DNA glycosylase